MESKNAEKIIAKFIKDLDISSDDYITVAELSTTLADGLTKTIDTNTALISDTLIRKIKSSQINPVVNNSSAYYDKDYRYKPSFWLYLSKSSGIKACFSLHHIQVSLSHPIKFRPSANVVII